MSCCSACQCLNAPNPSLIADYEKANEIYFRLGIIYKQQNKFASSLECFRYILNNPPRPLTEIDIWFQIGHVHEQQKEVSWDSRYFGSLPSI